MTYEERERQICRECSEKETCPYIPRKMEYKCQHLSDMMYGWELGHKDAISEMLGYLDFMDLQIKTEIENLKEMIK